MPVGVGGAVAKGVPLVALGDELDAIARILLLEELDHDLHVVRVGDNERVREHLADGLHRLGPRAILEANVKARRADDRALESVTALDCLDLVQDLRNAGPKRPGQSERE